ncbi:hypothetical protein [Mongoliibacter ruber]|uniref:Uncharacterized protein n=1 Tax=Mongoliibacter ruber TaxID=1750599 RepID=A0A2T0WN41_9BACT|nr:hypothetical protein [Mongoliibacter ruber]PRY88121.1 hypothetical protein CLW00_105242 [Mongoliibacter ruber]
MIKYTILSLLVLIMVIGCNQSKNQRPANFNKPIDITLLDSLITKEYGKFARKRAYFYVDVDFIYLVTPNSGQVFKFTLNGKEVWRRQLFEQKKISAKEIQYSGFLQSINQIGNKLIFYLNSAQGPILKFMGTDGETSESIPLKIPFSLPGAEIFPLDKKKIGVTWIERIGDKKNIVIYLLELETKKIMELTSFHISTHVNKPVLLSSHDENIYIFNQESQILYCYTVDQKLIKKWNLVYDLVHSNNNLSEKESLLNENYIPMNDPNASYFDYLKVYKNQFLLVLKMNSDENPRNIIFKFNNKGEIIDQTDQPVVLNIANQEYFYELLEIGNRKIITFKSTNDLF